MGYAYLEDSDDTRNSPSEILVRRLQQLGAGVVIHDPYVPEFQGDPAKMASGCDAAIVMVRHQAYQQINLKALKSALRQPILIDGRHIFDKSQLTACGFIYRSIGMDKTLNCLSTALIR
jgi:UDP-N-acetyl-D-mannosaminuronic acid dehydrogenase